MAERFQRERGIRQVQVRTGTAGAVRSLADRLEAFKGIGAAATQVGLAEHRRAAIKRGVETAAQVPIERKEGVTQVPEFKEETFFGGIEARAHNKALRAAYLASLDRDIRLNVGRIEAENKDNLQAFNDSIEGYSKGLLNNVDPASRGQIEQLLQDRVLPSQLTVQETDIKKQNKIAAEELQFSADSALDDAIRFANNGDIRSSADGLLSYSAVIDSQVEAGFITPVKAQELKREAELRATQANIVGTVRSLVTGGKTLEALTMLEKSRSKIPSGMSPEEHQDVVTAMKTEINNSINTRNRIEQEEADIVELAQKGRYANLAIGVATGRDDTNSAIQALRRNEITEQQFDKIINTLNKRGQGVDDFTLINQIEAEIQLGGSPEEIKDSIIKNTGTNLTEKTAGELLNKVDEYVQEESILKTSMVKRARNFIKPSISPQGPLGALDVEAEKRLARAIREFDTRVLEGEDPWRIADELVGKDLFEQAPNPMFGTKDDLKTALDLLDKSLIENQIDEETYKFEFNKIERLKELSENIKAFDKSRKEAEANATE